MHIQKSTLQSVDVHDLPPSAAAVVQFVAQAFRRQATRDLPRPALNRELPSAGRLIGGTSRSVIYEDVG